MKDYHIERIIVPAQYQAEFQTEKWKENDLFQLTDNIHVDVLHASKQNSGYGSIIHDWRAPSSICHERLR